MTEPARQIISETAKPESGVLVTATDSELQILVGKGDAADLSELFDYLVEFVTVYTSKNAEVKVCFSGNRLLLSMHASKRHWIHYMFHGVIREVDSMNQIR